MKQHVLTGMLLVGLAGCASTGPPQLLVSVTAELAEAEAQDLAELQPSFVREARDHRDAAWVAVDEGDSELAETHAWVSWLRLRTAENLETISQGDAVRRAGGVPVVAAVRPDGASEPTASRGQRAFNGPGRAGVGGSDADRAVREAEDARLRLLSAGLQPDLRWAEADALLQTAQRALERGEFERAKELGSRAAFVFEVVRLTRLGVARDTPLARSSALEGEPTSGLPSDAVASLAEREPGGSAGEATADSGLEPTPPVAREDGSPIVVVVPDASTGPTTPAPDTEEEPSERPRSRILSNILQSVQE